MARVFRPFSFFSILVAALARGMQLFSANERRRRLPPLPPVAELEDMRRELWFCRPAESRCCRPFCGFTTNERTRRKRGFQAVFGFEGRRSRVPTGLSEQGFAACFRGCATTTFWRYSGRKPGCCGPSSARTGRPVSGCVETPGNEGWRPLNHPPARRIVWFGHRLMNAGFSGVFGGQFADCDPSSSTIRLGTSGFGTSEIRGFAALIAARWPWKPPVP